MKKVIIGLVCISLLACKKDDEDTERPVITEFKVNGNDHEVSASPNSTLHFDIGVTDNEELNQIKIDIHHNFDGHGHRAATTRLEIVEIHNISGKSFQLHTDVGIHDSASAGPYHILVSALDKDGNQSDIKEIELLIENSGEQAVINLNTPMVGASYNLGDSVELSGTITDNNGIDEVEIVMFSPDAEVYDADYDLSSSTVTSWDFQGTGVTYKLPIPSNATTGEYDLFIKATDNDGNLTLKEIEFDVN